MSLRISTATGATVVATVNGDDAYWVQVDDPVTLTLTLQDGTERVDRVLAI